VNRDERFFLGWWVFCALLGLVWMAFLVWAILMLVGWVVQQ
jgi:hypothetical protein